ncbi:MULTISPECIES: DUF4270 domain-containing protein [Winogradskyella]|uniref:DUF4270 domain-containing protein n=1 Tax=Winogradskyella damuponensis TaxID=943939 RepID=A0ABP8D2W8_9FLAO
MKKNRTALQIIAFTLIAITFIACDKDYANLESDVINNDVATNFDILSKQYDVITKTKAFDPILNPVQTNNLGLSTLGVYDDIYGRTTSSFVTQLTTSTYDPNFGDDVQIDSVVVTIPYYSTVTGVDDDGNTTYEIDSVISKGDSYKSIVLRIFENNYFIRDFDPNAGFNENQAYFSNKSASASEMITNLEGEELTFVDYDDATGTDMTVVSNVIDINNNGHVLKDVNNLDDNGNKPILFSQAPAIRVMLEPTFWQNKIIDKEGDIDLSNQNNFLEYFRGLYFKAEAYNDDGSFLILDTNNDSANVTIYYNRLTPSTSDDADERDTAAFVLNFGPNKINFLETDFTVNEEESDTGDSKLYLKGGQGSVAKIKLFDGFYDEEAGITNFEKFRDEFVNLEDGEFESSKRLVNEANLVFYVDRDLLDSANEDPNNEPNRLYLYDIDNKTPLVDYYLDATNTNLPSFSKYNHLGALERVDEDDPSSKGVKYKLKITEHINNLLLRDSTNVELGLAVSLNINLEDPSLGFTQSKVQGSDELAVPVSSVLTPRGTILHGNNSENEDKKVYLEIYYTEPNN